jgi:hypothetical protein
VRWQVESLTKPLQQKLLKAGKIAGAAIDVFELNRWANRI